MTDVLITLGGNHGDVADTFRQALDLLGRLPGISVTAVSSFHGTSAVSLQTEAAPSYVNAAARLQCALPPLNLLRELQAVEARFGRERTRRWGARTLDLDLAWSGDAVIESPDLIVPHPAAWYRRFVLDPVVEIAPDFVDPIKRLSIKALRDRLLPRPLSMGLAGDELVVQSLLRRRPARSGSLVVGAWSLNDVEPTLLIWCGDPRDPARLLLPQVPRILRRWPAEVPLEEFVRIVATSALGSV